MIAGPRLVARVAIFAALIYVLNWATAYLPNIKLIFFIIFSAGFLWGAMAGLLVGLVGMAFWTLFNPYGPVGPPIMIAQVCGAAAGGLIGAGFRTAIRRTDGVMRTLLLALAALLCTLLYYVPVTVVDAWVYQPFWPRLIVGLPWVAIAAVSNIIIFTLLFGATRYLYEREKRA